MFEVHITDPAEVDIQYSYAWWRDYRPAEQAERWLESIYPAIATLNQKPERCPIVSDIDLGPGNFRQLLFGVGRRLTHRIKGIECTCCAFVTWRREVLIRRIELS